MALIALLLIIGITLFIWYRRRHSKERFDENLDRRRRKLELASIEEDLRQKRKRFDLEQKGFYKKENREDKKLSIEEKKLSMEVSLELSSLDCRNIFPFEIIST